ncbi:MAG: tetratricopeptide repeat protein [Armatimonadota bacterium]
MSKGPTSFRVIVVATVALIAALLVLGLPVLRHLTGGDASVAGVEAYRYRFERATRGSVTRALEQEIAFYQERIARDPQSGLNLALLGATYLRMARATGNLSWYLLAEQAARRSIANLPFSNDGAVVVLAKVAEARHDFKEAIRLAGRVSAQEDALAIVVTAGLGAGDVATAEQAADAMVKRTPTLGSLTLRALVYVARGKDDEAVVDFQRAIAAEEPGETGGSALARTLLGRLHARRGRLDLARSLYSEALRILPQHPLALIQLAELETRTGAYRSAERHLSQVGTISASPNIYDHAVLRGMGRLKVLQNDSAAASDLWDQAETRLRRDVAQGTFGHRRELAHLLLERGRPGNAEEALTLMRAEVRTRRDAETLSILAWALSLNGRPAEAREAMRDALSWGVRDAGLFYRAGLIEQALGNRAQAEAFFEKARTTDPRFDRQTRRALGVEP